MVVTPDRVDAVLGEKEVTEREDLQRVRIPVHGRDEIDDLHGTFIVQVVEDTNYIALFT